MWLDVTLCYGGNSQGRIAGSNQEQVESVILVHTIHTWVENLYLIRICRGLWLDVMPCYGENSQGRIAVKSKEQVTSVILVMFTLHNKWINQLLITD